MGLCFALGLKCVLTCMPLHTLLPLLSVQAIMSIAKIHRICVGSHVPRADLLHYFNGHQCMACSACVTVFSMVQHVHVCKQEKSCVIAKTDIQCTQLGVPPSAEETITNPEVRS